MSYVYCPFDNSEVPEKACTHDCKMCVMNPDNNLCPLYYKSKCDKCCGDMQYCIFDFNKSAKDKM